MQQPNSQLIMYGMRHAVQDAVKAARVDMLEVLIRYGARGWKGSMHSFES
jgi:hypothetical protein